MKLIPSVNKSDEVTGYVFWCPGCEEYHRFNTGPENRDGRALATWTFNGNIDKPSFQPSLLLTRHKSDYEGCGPRCHLFLTDGQLIFLSDCEHALAGQTVPLPEDPNESIRANPGATGRDLPGE